MQAIYLVYGFNESDRPVAAFDNAEQAEKFSRHLQWARYSTDRCPVVAVPLWADGSRTGARFGEQPAYTVREATEEEWAAADELWDPRDEDGWRGTVDEDGEVCDGRA